MNSASHETHRPEPTVDRPEPTFGGKTVQEWREGDPVIDALADLRETAWLNPGVRPVDEALPDVGLTAADVADAAARLRRFAALGSTGVRSVPGTHSTSPTSALATRAARNSRSDSRFR